MFELGNNLRAARQQRRIDLVIAEQDTKIRSKYLSALEDEEFDVLPGPVFVRGFLRTYSRYLGLDPQLFIDEYNARFGRFEEVEEHASPALGRMGLAHERATRGRRVMRTAVIVSLVLLALLAWLGIRAGDDTTTPPQETPISNSVTSDSAATGQTGGATTSPSTANSADSDQRKRQGSSGALDAAATNAAQTK